jgi:hypothetical protein
MIYRGACHCGVVSAAYETNAPVRLRADGCGFCSSRGVKSASRYRFGHKTADFLICPDCGTYVATHMDSPRGPIGVINVVGLGINDLKHLPVTLTSLEGESTEERLARRISRWTPMIITEAA